MSRFLISENLLKASAGFARNKKMIQGHGGNIYEIAKSLGCSDREIVDMSSNVCPLGTVPGLKEMIAQRCEEITRLPEVDSLGLRACFAESFGLRANHILAGNGTTEFIYMIPPALKVKKALIVGPTYSDYADACRAFGADITYYPAKEQNDFKPNPEEIQSKLSGVDTVFICNPNNPTGQFISGKPLKLMFSSYPKVRFVIDESYLPFIPNWQTQSLITSSAHNIIVLQSFSKIFGIPGLRLGFMIAPLEIIEAFEPFKQPWNVNSLAQAVGKFLISQKLFVQEAANFVQEERVVFLGYLEGLETLHHFPSSVHFILFKLGGDLKAPGLFRLMAQHKILIRDCSNFPGLSDRFFRIALKTPEANKRCADILGGILARS